MANWRLIGALGCLHDSTDNGQRKLAWIESSKPGHGNVMALPLTFSCYGTMTMFTIANTAVQNRKHFNWGGLYASGFSHQLIFTWMSQAKSTLVQLGRNGTLQKRLYLLLLPNAGGFGAFEMGVSTLIMLNLSYHITQYQVFFGKALLVPDLFITREASHGIKAVPGTPRTTFRGKPNMFWSLCLDDVKQSSSSSRCR